jgi:hypothetical protein
MKCEVEITMNVDESILSKLTDDQKKAVEDATTPEELLALAKEYGYELPPEQLEAIAGGWCITKCHLYNPDCGTFGVPV